MNFKLGIVFMIVAICCCGCASREELSNKIGSAVNDGYTENKENNGTNSKVAGTNTENDMDLMHGNEHAESIAACVLQMPEIKTASIVLIGNNAIVGVNLEDTVADEDIAKIKEDVETLVLSKIPELNRVSVTASPELMERVHNVAGQVAEGNKTPDINDELNQILTRVIPTI